MLPSRCFLFTFVLSYGRFFKTLFKLFCFVSFSKKTYCLLGIYHSCMKGRRPSYSDATSFDMFRQVSTCYDKFRHVTRQVYTGFCLSFKDISQSFIFFLVCFFIISFLVCIFANFFFSSRLHSYFFFPFTLHKIVFFSFHSFLWLHYICCCFSYVLGSVIIIDWLVVGDFLFFLSLKLFLFFG